MKTIILLFLTLLTFKVHGQTTSIKVDSTRLESFIITREYLKQSKDVDTTLITCTNLNPLKVKSLPVNYLGNLGSPSINTSFGDRSYGDDFVYSEYFSLYFAQSTVRPFFKTLKPYTYIYYTSGGSKKTFEQNFDVFHTQNISKKWNFGIRLNNFSSAGVYASQRTRLYAVSAFSSYEGDYYSVFGQMNYNSAQCNENGGLRDNTVLSLLNNSKNTEDGLPVRLNNADSKVKNFNFRIDQILKNIPSKSLYTSGLLTLGHTIELSTYKRNYKDDTRSGIDTLFYNNNYGVKGLSNDSVVFKDLKNTLSFSLGAVGFWGSPSLRVYIGNQIGQWNNSFPANTSTYISGLTVTNGSLQTTIYNNWLGASFNGVSKSFVWDFDVKSYWTGSRQGDFDARFKLKFGQNNWKFIPGLIVEGWQKRTSPSWMLSNLFSNHYIWNNALNPTNETTLKGALLLNFLHTNITGQWSRFDNYIIFDNSAKPKNAEAFHYFEFKADNILSFWKFKTQNSGFAQTVSRTDMVHLPDFGFSHSLWLDYNIHFNLTGGDLNMNIGYLVQYYSSFYADAYMPATGVFYKQNVSKIGNYPYVDLFAIFQVKRTQFFLRYDHVNEGFSGRNYYSSYLYPMPGRMFKFGIRWYLAD